MENSILKTTKKVLGIDPSYNEFDTDILMHINSVFSTLNQLGIGPTFGYAIEDDAATWADYLGVQEIEFNFVKTYMYLRVRLLFDPPTTSFHLTALKEQITELEWRISVQRETYVYVPVVTVLDGGSSIGG